MTDADDNEVYSVSQVSLKNNRWQHKMDMVLENGHYTLSVYADGELVTEADFVVGGNGNG